MSRTRRSPRALAVISAAPHFRWEGRFWSHEPYVREIDLWAELFDRIVIVGPLEDECPTPDAVPFGALNISVRGVPPTGGDGLRAKITQLALLPLLVSRIVVAMARADAVHVRCPGNVGLLGVVFAPLCTRRMVAKYAGQWASFPGEKWTVRLQRTLLASCWWRGPVTVYGEWPNQPAHVVPFFTSILYRHQIPDHPVPRRRRAGALSVLFVGRLSGPKNVATLLRALAQVRGTGMDATLTIVGDGAERQNLEELAAELSIIDSVEFAGALRVDEVLAHYREGDTLVLASESEGWPKAIAEAMAFGLVCIGSDRGIVPQMLDAGRGVVVPPRDVSALAAALQRVADDPVTADEIGRRARTWGQRYSLEDLRDALAALLTAWWQTEISSERTRITVIHVTDTLAAGGAERMAVNLANGLPREQFDVHLCTTRGDGPLAGEVRHDVGRLTLRRRGRWSDLAAVVRLARYCRNHGIDVIHAHGTSLFLAAAVQPLAGGAALIWHDHLGAPTASRHRRALLFRLAVSRSDHVVTVTRSLQRWVQRDLRVPRQHTSTMPNFVDPPPPGPPAADLPGVPGRRIACVANIRSQKDHLTLVRAMARVCDAIPDAHALLLGAPVDPTLVQGIHREAHHLGIADAVSLLGERSDVADVLAACDIGVLSSRSEGFPLALLEYGTAGLATVVTDVGECRQILDEGAAGRLVTAGDPKALAAEIVALLNDPVAARRLGTILRERIEARYSSRVVLERVEALYRSLVDGRTGRP